MPYVIPDVWLQATAEVGFSHVKNRGWLQSAVRRTWYKPAEVPYRFERHRLYKINAVN
jgi:hypothetical protein